MRSLFTVASLCCVCLALGQAETGRVRIYRPDVGPAIPWNINDNRTLLWNGIPYLPVGLHIDGTVEAVEKAKASGVQDVIVDLAADGSGWPDVIAALKAANIRFMISLGSLAPASLGFAVEPQMYRVDGLMESKTLEFNLPGCTEALAVVVLQRDGSVQSQQRVKFEGGRAAIPVDTYGNQEHILLLYPRIPSLAQTDYWEAFDRHRDGLLAALKRNPPGPGFRGLINPLGSILDVRRTKDSFVPDSPIFISEFASYLSNRYRTFDTAVRAWSMSTTDLTDFSSLARLVPLWSGTRGIDRLWDPKTDKLYPCERQNSLIWADIAASIAEASARRTDRLIQTLRREIDVPLIQEWTGWLQTYERSSPEIDGLGIRLSDTSAGAVTEQGAWGASSLLRWSKPGWLVATQIGTPDASLDSITASVDDLASLGARGWFFRVQNQDLASIIRSEAERRSLDASSAEYTVLPVYFPKNAMNPAMPQRLPAGHWWLPSPVDGDRIDLEPDFHGYRYSDGSKLSTVLWSAKGEVRVKLKCLDPKAITFTTIDGSDPKRKNVRGGVEVNLTPFPLIVSGSDELPVPEACVQATTDKLSLLLAWAEANTIQLEEERFQLSEVVGALERSPGAAYAELRRLYWLITERVSNYVWIEAEAPRRASLADTLDLSSCSGGAALDMRAQEGVPGGSPIAEYQANLRANAPHEIWVAARIPAEYRKHLVVTVDSQPLPLVAEPSGTYGEGFSWFYFGSAKPSNRTAKVTLSADAPQGIDFAVDAILLYPGTIKPNGPYPPEFKVPGAIKPGKG